MEAYSQLQISMDLGYICQADFKNIKNKFFDVSRLLNGLKKSFVDNS